MQERLHCAEVRTLIFTVYAADAGSKRYNIEARTTIAALLLFAVCVDIKCFSHLFEASWIEWVKPAANVVVDEKATFCYTDGDGVVHFHISVRPDRGSEDRCPLCGRKCPGYDHDHGCKTWRGLDLSSVLVEVSAFTHRVCCPEHGVVPASMPWAYAGSRFTKAFDLTVAWLATHLSRNAASEFMRIDWATVGRCVSRSLKDLEADHSRRLNWLVNIGIDETSYRKGHRYITVVVNHDTNTVVWAHDRHGKTVLEQFYEELTPEQRASIRVVTGDGARRITDYVNKYTPDCERCVDPFHVVEWAMEAVGKVRVEAWRKAQAQARELEEGRDEKPGPETDDTTAAIIKAKENAKAIKTSAYTPGKAPENLTAAQKLKLEQIAVPSTEPTSAKKNSASCSKTTTPKQTQKNSDTGTGKPATAG